MLKRWLEHPLTRGLPIDAPETTALRRTIIKQKSFLRQIYLEWYREIMAWLPSCEGPVLEIGAGAGFLRDLLPGLITSDIIATPGVALAFDARRLPFADGVLRAIVMTNVLHHLPGPRHFFAEAARCVKPGGTIVMLEPWVTPWSTFIYTRLHHEPFEPAAPHWEFPDSGPLSGANGALPWILFHRDRQQFEREFPTWRIDLIRPAMPLRYLLSGGVSLRSLMPGWTFPFWKAAEALMRPFMNQLAMFALIRLCRDA
jgi:SAM-dependent methyltransferase